MNNATTFGPYHLHDRVSVGGMAEVFKAMEYGADGFEREVAVKRILPHVAEDEEFITMFKDEAHIAVQLKHGNIAQIYNLGFENDTFYIALEYVHGKDVRAIFERGRQSGKTMPIPQACFVVMQVCEGLDYAHNKKDKYGRPLNIIHRDVSPPNILVSYEGEVKLIDFGVAKAAGRASHTQSGILKGKFGYMSPEQVKGRALDRRSDVFALGVVLWEVLTGRRLFQGDTDFATLEMVRDVTISPPSAINPEVSGKLEAIVLKALAAEPDDRYQSAMELHDALQAHMFEEGMFASRKDLAAWMREQYAREIELEKQAAQKTPPRPPAPAKKGGVPKKTMMMGPGQMGAPPPPPGGKPPPPPPGGRAGPPPPAPPGPPAPPSRPSSVPTAAHKIVSANVPTQGGGPPKPKGGRTRAKTMLMSPKQAPVGRPTPPPKPKPKPTGASASSSASYEAPATGSDFDWDDDELETRLFDGDGNETSDAGGAGREAAGPAARGPAKPIATGAPPPVTTGSVAAKAPTALNPNLGGGPTGLPRPGGAPAPAPVAAAVPAAVPMSASAPGLATPATSMQAPAMPATSMAAASYSDEEFQKKGGIPVWVWAVAAVLLIGAGIGIAMSMGGGEEEAPVAAAGDTAATAATGPVAPTSGSVSLTLAPADAKVLIDGQEVPGTGSPRVLPDVAAGAHKLEISKGDDFMPFTQDVNVTAGQALPLDVKLGVRTVTLTVECDPKTTKVELLAGDEATEIGSGASVKHKVTREVGVSYKLKGSASGYLDDEQPLVFDGQAAQTVKLSLVPDPKAAVAVKSSGSSTKKKVVRTTSKAKTAELRIGVAPGNPPADVYVDGKKQSKKTPVFVNVAPGSHTVKWSWGSESSTQKVSVGDGESKTIKGAK